VEYNDMTDLNIPWQSGEDIRRKFVEFFEQRGHLRLPSSSLIPHNDKTVLLTTAGMQQMIPYFLGLETPPHNRLVTVQKCFRTPDIDEVGDERHSTFFFMLGNFSVRDYFKKESLAWTWEFFTEWMRIPPERLYPTVHPDDDEAYRIWRDEVGVPEERIYKLEDNWWRAGPTGPNGPDSEVYVDRGAHLGCGEETCAPGCECERFLEVWNNVFMQYNTTADGVTTPLAKPCVDTGMGLERLVMLAQGGRTLYDTDLYQPIIQKAASLAGVHYDRDPQTDRALRVIADHLRGATFLVADGVLPGNEGRSYVLRRVVRRAVRHGRLIGLDRPFVGEIAALVIDMYGEHNPELTERRQSIVRTLEHEEAAFSKTLQSGMNRLYALTTELKARGESSVPGEEAFRLYDTYGFPYDLTVELAEEEGLHVDGVGFTAAMERQRETSRSGANFRDTSRDLAELYASITPRTEFLGYTEVKSDASVVAILDAEGSREQAEAGQRVAIVLDRTPFYAEAGGQVGDTGEIRTETGRVNIDDTHKPASDLYLHIGTVIEGFVSVGDRATAAIDSERRQEIRRNHTATHLLHKALRLIVGEDARQAGSLVAPDRLRFDFTAMEAVSPNQLRTITEIVNRQVVSDLPVETRELPYDEAVAQGAMALFGEKYGDLVRVVGIEDFSQELCGGTHVRRTGEIGPFVITSESSVASGVRRIEALTGTAAIARMIGQQQVVEGIGRELKVSWTDLPDQVQGMQERIRQQEREIGKLRGQLAGARSGDLLSSAVEVDGTRVLASKVSVASRDELRQMGDRLRDSLQSGVIVLGAVIDERPALLAMVTPDVVGQGVRAGDIIREVAPHIDGRGGGRPELAEAGGKDPEGVERALAAVVAVVTDKRSGTA
jgi:alanyl-tRNA synthetase